MFSINKYKYVDVKTRNKFEVFARDVNFEDKLIERQNNFEDIPIGCRSCGGPYPNCKSSCPMFDD